MVTKTFSFAVVHMTVAFCVGYLMTGSWAVGGALAVVEPLCNTVAYHFHERFWRWRRPQAEERVAHPQAHRLNSGNA